MEINLLTKSQVCGPNALTIFKKYGTNAAVTDFSILLGCGVTSDHTSDSSFYDNDTRSADYFTKTKTKNRVIAISSYGFEYNGEKHLDDRYVGIRPIVKLSEIKGKTYDETISDKRVKEVKFGQYPQTICDTKTYITLEQLYQEGKLKPNDKEYITDSNIKGDFKKQTHPEYEFENNRYIRFVADRNLVKAQLSDKSNTIYNKPYWIKVEPIIWMVDEEEDIAVSKKILVSGLPFDIKYEEEFEKSFIYNYLNDYFAKEIVSNIIRTNYSRFGYVEKIIENLSLEELQELRMIIETQMKEKAFVKSKGGIK